MPLAPEWALGWCLAQTLVVIGSLYAFVPSKVRQLDREDPVQIRHRVVAFCIATVLCVCGTRWLLAGTGQSIVFLQGLSVQSTLFPLGSFVLLFSGQLVQVFAFPQEFDHQQLNVAPEFWANFRNLFFAPIPEEIIFRSLLGSTLLAAGFSHRTLLFGTPLFFGLAHVHLSVVKYWKSRDGMVMVQCLFQVAYTSLFGALMMDVLLRTQNLLAVILIHSFCNLCGFPNLVFWRPPVAPLPKLALVGLCYVGGIALYVHTIFAT